mgnify:CR=1 FL=1
MEGQGSISTTYRSIEGCGCGWKDDLVEEGILMGSDCLHQVHELEEAVALGHRYLGLVGEKVVFKGGGGGGVLEKWKYNP